MTAEQHFGISPNEPLHAWDKIPAALLGTGGGWVDIGRREK